MPSSTRSLPVLCLALFSPGLVSQVRPSGPEPAPAERTISAGHSSFTIPFMLVENAGQWPSDVLFAAERDTHTAAFTREGWWFFGRDSRRTAFRFADSREDVAVTGEDRLPQRHSYFLGNDGERWRGGVPSYASILYEGLYDGVDVRVREASGQLEYDLLLAPGATLEDVAIEVSSATGLHIAPDGRLCMQTPLGVLHQDRPYTWQEDADGSRQRVACEFRLLGEQRYGFSVDGRDPDKALVIDPGFTWVTRLGSSSNDRNFGLSQAGPTGEVVVIGETSELIPVTFPGAVLPTNPPGGMVSPPVIYVTRFDRNGLLVSSAKIGGNGLQVASDVVLRSDNTAVVVGYTGAPNFPTTANAFDQTIAALDQDAFLLVLNASGTALNYSTFLGGPGVEEGLAVAADPTNNNRFYLCGCTMSTGTGFPTTPGAAQSTLVLGTDGFISLLDTTMGASGLIASTLLGGNGNDEFSAITTDATTVMVCGVTTSTMTPPPALPTTPNEAYSESLTGGVDLLLGRFSPTLGPPLHLTYLGGSFDERVEDMQLVPGGSGEVYVVGGTRSGTPGVPFPTTPGALLAGTTNQGLAGIVFRYEFGTGQTANLEASTYLDGTKTDSTLCTGLDVDRSGTAFVIGTTNDDTFPTTTGAYSTALTGVRDVFVSKLSANLSQLFYSTFFGGINGAVEEDSGVGIVHDNENEVIVSGHTSTSTFPTSGVPMSMVPPRGNQDTWLARSDLLPNGCVKYGVSTGPDAPFAIGAFEEPTAGNPNFQVFTNAPLPFLAAFIISGAPTGPTKLPVAGCPDLYVSLAPPALVLTALTTDEGSFFPLSLAGTSPGQQVYFQFLVVSGPDFSASNALQMTVQ